MSTPSTALVTTEPLKQALALATEAGDIKALKEVHALASALRKGAQARGMGLEAENQAAEVVIRSERAIGLAIGELKASGRFGHQGDSGDVRDKIIEALEAAGGPLTSAQVVEATGLANKSVVQVLHNNPAFAKVDERKGGAWRVVDERLADLRSIMRIRDLGITESESSNFQRLASMPDDRFEDILDELRSLGSRIAKVNFYAPARKAADVREYERSVEAEVPTSSAFTQFRAGAYALLEWEVAEEGTGAYALNTMLALPTDELAEVAGLIRLLAEAYTKVRAARS